MSGTRSEAPDAPPRCLPPERPVRREANRLPVGTCDAHFHVFGAEDLYPLDDGRSYTPALVTIDDYRDVMAAYGIDRAVVVQPSVYGFDNSALFAALNATPDRLRGVAVLRPDAPESLLAMAHALGVRGVRVNTRSSLGLTLADVPRLADRIAPLGWHIQLQIGIEDGVDLGTLAERTGVPIVVDHFGFASLAAGPKGRAFDALVGLCAEGRCFVKLSAAPRLVGPPEAYRQLQPFVDRLVTKVPRSLFWGSDWPHTECFDTVPAEDPLIDLVFQWLPTAELQKLVLRDNPSRFYWPDEAITGEPVPA